MKLFSEIQSLPPQFPHDLRVLVVDHDTTSLNSIVEMCIRCNYQVTTCCNASFALNLLKETKNLYDVILIEAQMSDMDSYHFLQHVSQLIKIPVVMMCDDEQSTSPSLVMKAIEKGACGYWIKPLSEGQIKNIWQHVVRKILKENKQRDQVLETSNAKDLKKIGRDDDHAPTSSCDDNVNNYQPSTKKYRLSWSQELHRQFLSAVNQLGIHEAKPKEITKLMNVAGLTREQVASHLQNLRLRLKRSTEETDVENKMHEVWKRKSKWDEFELYAVTVDSAVQNNVPSEVVNSVPNSSIECDNISSAQPLNTVKDYEVSDNIYHCYVKHGLHQKLMYSIGLRSLPM